MHFLKSSESTGVAPFIVGTPRPKSGDKKKTAVYPAAKDLLDTLVEV
jgi:hypothetical protein